MRVEQHPVLAVEVEKEGHEDLATTTERGLKEFLRRQGWTTANIPGHRWNQPGPDLVAYRLDPLTGQLSLRILDNKATAATTSKPGRVSRATGLSADSLAKNLPSLIASLSRSSNPLDRRALDALVQVRARAEAAVARAVAKSPNAAAAERARRNATLKLPRGVGLLVTAVRGRAPGIARSLRRKNVRFVPENKLALLREILELDGAPAAGRR